MIDIQKIQSVLKDLNIDTWLFTDFHDREPIAQKFLQLTPGKISTRRWFYLISATSDAQKLVHQIEAHRLEELPGETHLYAGYEKLKGTLARLLSAHQRVAMQYSPYCNLPTVSTVDAGCVELVKSLVKEVVSSGDLIQIFEASLSQAAIDSHIRACDKVHSVLRDATTLVAESLAHSRALNEFEVQQFILQEFKRSGLNHGAFLPIVAVNEHAANPHFELSRDSSRALRKGDRLLIDLWAKENSPGAIFYDIAWCYQLGSQISSEYANIFEVAKNAREAAKNLVCTKFARSEPVLGCEVDDVARSVVASAGLADYFTHRTGHSIHEEIHANGVNMDNFETHDDRPLLKGTCFSIEPGIYKGDIGVRTEINVLIDLDSKAHAYGEEQQHVVSL